MRSPRLLPLCLLAAAVLLVAASASATTILPVSDARLADTSPLIVVARAEGELPGTAAQPVTDWLFAVERVLKGELADSGLIVRVPGGTNAEGDRLHVEGAPEFRRNERVLLFLSRRPDGAWGIRHFALGVFHGVRADGRTAALGSLPEAKPKAPRRPGKLRDFDAFARWIADRAAGDLRRPDYRFRPSKRGLRAVAAAYTLIIHQGMPGRWFEFDSGGAVVWRMNGEQAGLPGGGVEQFGRATGAWTAERHTPVVLVAAGTSAANGGLDRADGENVMLMGDPNGEVEDLDCREGGGTLAIGGWWERDRSGFFNGAQYHRIEEGDIVVNNGLDCLVRHLVAPRAYFERLFGHELGHTVGIGHTHSDTFALMYYQIPRSTQAGAVLRDDDREALRVLYEPGHAPPPPPIPNCGVEKLCLLGGRIEVTATWSNQYDGSTGSARALRASEVAGYLYFTDPNNYELIVKVLDFGDRLKIFYGQLTNLHFTLTVKDTRTGAVKTYSNTAGDCGGLDENGFVAGAVIAAVTAAAGGGNCTADADTLCLLNRRFALEMSWRNQYDGSSGHGLPKRLTELTGAFGFTDPANLELLVKTLDFGDRVLVIYGALSNLEYSLRVTDTISGRSKTYDNPAGRYCGGLDNDF